MKSQSQVELLLAKPVKKVEKIKASFTLDRELFESFKSICDEKQLTQSELLDAMFSDLKASHIRQKH